MSSLKGERAGTEIQRELSNILLLDAKDEDFKNVTITAVDVSNDLSFAKVYFTTLDDREHVEHDLNNAAGFFLPPAERKINVRRSDSGGGRHSS